MPFQNQASTLIGRTRELDALRKSLDAALEGAGQIVAVAGEPGIGKTRLVTEAQTIASSQGFATLTGSSLEEGGTPPYWPWLQCFESLTERLDDDELRLFCGSNAGVLSEFLPGLAARIGSVDRPPDISDLRQARFRLFQAVADFTAACARAQPLVFALEDLHWADESTLELLEFLPATLSGSRVLIIATYRDVQLRRRHPLPRTLGALNRHRSFTRVRLGRLDQQATLDLAGQLGLQDPRSLSRVYEATEGNPFFVGEVVQLLLDDPGGNQRIPEGIKEAIGRRLDALSNTANDALEVGAVAGRAFSPSVITAVLADRYSSSEVLAGLDEALTFRLLEQRDGNDSLQFTHSLIHESLLDELALNDRVELHAAVLSAKEKLYASDLARHANELLEHARAAQSIVGAMPLVNYAALAGEAAVRSRSFGEALDIFQTAADTARQVEMTAEIADMLQRLAYLIIWWLPLGHPAKPRAVDLLRRAFEFHRDRGDKESAIAVVTPAAGSFVLVHVYELLQEALALADPDSEQAAWLECRAGIAVGIEKGDFKAATTHFDSANTIADRLGDDGLKLRVVGMQALSEARAGRPQSAYELAEKIWNAPLPLDDPLPPAHAAEATFGYVAINGELKRAIELTDFMIEAGKRRGELSRAMGGLLQKALLSMAAGDPRLALETADAAISTIGTAANLQYMKMAILTLLGDEPGAWEACEAGDEIVERIYVPGEGSWIQLSQIRSHMYWSIRALYKGLEEQSEKEFTRVREGIDAEIKAPSSWESMFRKDVSLCLAIHAAVAKDPVEARRWYESLDPADETSVGLGNWNFDAFISRPRLMAKLTVAMNDLPTAAKWFERGVEQTRKLGMKTDLAWGSFELAELVVSSPGIAVDYRPDQLLAESAKLAEEIGLKPLIERIQELTAKLPSGRTGATHPAGLTEREVEVLRELARGSTNREIAGALFISQNTVIRHVSNIFSKTGASNRTDAARFAMEHDLVKP